MHDIKAIRSALISVYSKTGLDPIVSNLNKLGIKIYSTGGTAEYIRKLGVEVHRVEALTNYPSILGGRVKTLHPKVFGGILARRHEANDMKQLLEYDIPEIDLVIVDLYPFEETLKETDQEEKIIEKIDIGGISLIRAAAKNYKDCLVLASRQQYSSFGKLLTEKKGESNLIERRNYALEAFRVSAHYDSAISQYFSGNEDEGLEIKFSKGQSLRYGENPHQKALFFGAFDDAFIQLNGKAISYNNLVDIDSAVRVMADFEGITVAVIKHTNTCGLAERDSLIEAWNNALAGDPVSAFGGIVICNRTMNLETAAEINKLFVEVVIAPDYDSDALEILKSKKNRILLQQKLFEFGHSQFKSLLNGVLWQQTNLNTESDADMKPTTIIEPTPEELEDLVFANKAVKHLKSNAIALVKNRQLIGIGTGQTSRVAALEQAISKAKAFHFDLKGAVMASDAFFPFPDCVEIANNEGIKAIVQPGGSIRDQQSIDYCNEHQIAMVFTGIRHFKHG